MFYGAETFGNGVPLPMGRAMARAVKEAVGMSNGEAADRLAYDDLRETGGIADAP